MKAIAFLCAVACFAVPRHEALAQTAGSQKARGPGQERAHAPSAPVQTYASSELDRTIEKLPPDFNGHDIASVYSALEERKRQSEKSEFETTEQWHRREETLLLDPIVGRMTVGSIWAFVIDDVSSVYDADNQVLQIHVPLHSVRSSTGLASNFFSTWAKFEGVQSSYLGTNGFGATIEVHNTRYTIHHVAFGNAQSFPMAEVEDHYSWSSAGWAVTGGGFRVSVPSGPDTAKQMKQELSALAVCKLTAPFAVSDYYSESATVGSPYASQYRDDYVITELLEVWAYDRKSGVIHAKLRPHD